MANIWKQAETVNVRLTFTEEVLGQMPTSKKLYEDFIASKAPDAMTTEEEIEEFGIEKVMTDSTTVFQKTEDGVPFIYDYQIRGAFKDACGLLRRIPGSESSKIKAYKKVIDGNIFVRGRKNPFHLSGEQGICQRPLRADTPMGTRNALASSETVPKGSTLTFQVVLMDSKAHKEALLEWLNYFYFHGIGQWRNSGKGTCVFEILDDHGNVIDGNKDAPPLG